MEEKIKKSVASAIIMGMIIPLSSLIYVRKGEAAIALLSFFIFAILVLIFTPITYFATSMWIFLIIIGIVLLFSFCLGVWYAYSGIDDEDRMKDQGLWVSAYIVLALLIMVLSSYIPASLFITKDAYLDFAKNEMLIVQENPELKYLRVFDYVVFLDEGYDESLGQIIAVPGDVLKYEKGKILRNDEPHDITINLPMQSWIVPEDIMLVKYKRSMLSNNDLEGEGVSEGENRGTQPKPAVQKINETNTEAIEENTEEVIEIYEAVILPTGRIKSKALYTLFSTNFFNIGRSLTQNAIP